MISFLVSLCAGLLLCFSQASFTRNTSLYSFEECVNDKQHSYLSARHIEAGGIGYDKGYTSLDAFFAPDPKPLSLIPFLDLRGHVFNNGQLAANVGIGIRRMNENLVLGFNAYYDYRNAQRNHYNQVGFGLEMLGRRYDFRVNGYVPIDRNAVVPYLTEFAEFAGHEMIVLQQYQIAMKGAQAEAGVYFGKSRWCDFYAAAGAYYFKGTIGPQTWGGKARFMATFKKYWTLELSNSYDKTFHNRFQCSLTFTLPLGGESFRKQTNNADYCDEPDVLFSRMVQPVQRQEIVVEESLDRCAAAIDPVTGQPYNFVFVDNNSNSLGTYESPYPTLALAQANSKAGDIIYVFPGDGTTKGMDAGITLKTQQKLWGSGIDYTLSASQGSIVIPAHSSSAPTMTNTSGDGLL